MNESSSDVAFSPSVKRVQGEKGSRRKYAAMEQAGGWPSRITDDLAAFIAQLDMFYLGTASLLGQPYIQYRGGPPGFLRVIDEETLGFADFSGNRQFITLGNLAENPKSFLFLMDYEQGRRIKIWGQARVVEDDPALLASLKQGEYEGRAERAILFRVEAWDVNCRQHIHLRFSQHKVAPIIEQLKSRVRDLEAELQELRGTARPAVSEPPLSTEEARLPFD